MYNPTTATRSVAVSVQYLKSFAMVTLCIVAGCSDRAPGPRPIIATRVLGEVGSSPGQYSYPRAMEASDDSLWIIDKQARVQRIDPTSGRARGEWQMPEWEMGKPTGIGIWNPTDADGDEIIFVPDTHYFRVMVYRATDAKPGIHSIRATTGTAEPGSESNAAKSPEPLARFGTYGQGPGQFIYLTDVALLAANDGTRVERLYVSEYGGNDRISIFEPPSDITASGGEYRFIRSFGRFGSGSDSTDIQFNRPQSMVIDSVNRELIVTDSCNHRIGRFTLDGELIAWIGGPATADDAPGSFMYPYGITLLGDGTAMIAEFGNNRVQRIRLSDGSSLGVFGGPGREPGRLATPWAVSIVGDEAFVLDSGNNRIQVFEKPD